MKALQSRIEELAVELAGEAATQEEVNGLMRRMMKSVYEKMLDAEMDVHLGRVELPGVDQENVVTSPGVTKSEDETQSGEKKKSPNRRNGRSKKTVQSELGEVTLSTPRDRDGEFEPQLIGKYERRVSGLKRLSRCTPKA